MNRFQLCILTLALAACGMPDTDTYEEDEVGVVFAELTSSVPFWYGTSRLTTGYGPLIDTPGNGLLGWTGPDVATPYGPKQVNATSFEVGAQSTKTGEATLYWRTHATATGDHRIVAPSLYLIDGYARASMMSNVEVFVTAQVRVGTRLAYDRSYLVASVSTNLIEKTSSFANLYLTIANEPVFHAYAGEVITYQVALFIRAKTGPVGSAFVGIRDFGAVTNAMPNTAQTIGLVGP